MKVHFLVPPDFETRASGGNVYDRRLVPGLRERGWEIVVHEDLPELAADDLVLADSLVAATGAEHLIESPVTVVPLVHMLFGTPGERELLTTAPAVVTTSRWTQRCLGESVDPRRVFVAPPGVVPVHTDPAPPEQLVCVAAVGRAKGQDVLLDALALLTDLDWRCTFVGPTDDVGYVDRLRKQAADAGLADRVVLAGELGGAELDDMWTACGLLVLPTRAEAYGMVVTEALARGIPVVASAVGGVPEALGEVGGAHPGMLVRPDDPRALATALRRWLTDAALRRWLRRVTTLRIPTLPRWASTAARVDLALASAAGAPR